MEISHEEINKIMDGIQPYAKIVCDRLYAKVLESGLEPDDCFKAVLDMYFDEASKSKIQEIKDSFDVYCFEHKTTNIDIKDIKLILDTYGSTIYIAARGSGNTMTKAMLFTINQSVKLAFIENLAEYMGIDKSEIIS